MLKALLIENLNRVKVSDQFLFVQCSKNRRFLNLKGSQTSGLDLVPSTKSEFEPRLFLILKINQKNIFFYEKTQKSIFKGCGYGLLVFRLRGSLFFFFSGHVKDKSRSILGFYRINCTLKAHHLGYSQARLGTLEF